MKYIPKFTPFALLLVFLFLISCLSFNWQLHATEMNASIRKDGKLDFLRADGSVITSINIEIAETPESQAKGLMDRELSDFSSGMLFVFREVKPRDFWMHNTPTSLDLIFVGEDFCVLNICKQTEPMSDRIYSSGGPVKYVVEVRVGFAERYEIKEGTKIRWKRL